MRRAAADAAFAALAVSGQVLDEAVVRRILALGAGAVPRLFEHAETDLTTQEWSWARAHAVRLLIELRLEETFDRLLPLDEIEGVIAPVLSV